MKALTKKEIEKLAPAVYADGRDETRTSDKYQKLSTAEAIKVLGKEGLKVTGASQMFARKKDNAFTRHVVTLTHTDHLKAEGKLEVVPNILLFNSHNGTTALKLQAGFFRFVCSNGLIVGDTLSETRLRHSGSAADQLLDQLQDVAQITKSSVEAIEHMKATKLSKGAMEAFAQEAISIRVRGGVSGSFYEPKEVLAPRRDEDTASDVWTVFNRVQENLVRGGISGMRESGRVVTLRPLQNIRRNTEFNQQLWDLAQQAAA